jgi:glycosyltransferase involved in cell wall biosynthesis
VGAPLSILCIGRLVPDKGQSVLLDALALMEDGIAQVTFVGNGPSREALERRVAQLGLADRVRLTGGVGQDEIPGFYADADVFCLPSFAEGIPVVLMEAMATGLPVVTTKIMGIPELVLDGESGVLVSPGRAEALADALTELALDEGRRKAMGKAGRARVESIFGIADAADAMRRRLDVLGT